MGAHRPTTYGFNVVSMFTHRVRIQIAPKKLFEDPQIAVPHFTVFGKEEVPLSLVSHEEFGLKITKSWIASGTERFR